MIIFRLAFRNIIGAGLRTWLNVVALSFSFVAIIFLQGLYSGMSGQMEKATIDAQYGGGQYWQSSYDPYDPLTLEDSHGKVPAELQKLITENKAVPILIQQGTIYPGGRFQSALIKGINPGQRVLTIPSHLLKASGTAVPALIGSRMSKSTGLKAGDYVTARWRDINGTFDANEIEIVEVMKTDVPEIDNGQLWIPIDIMRKMMSMPEEATYVVLEKGSGFNKIIKNWDYKDLNFLTSDIRALFLSKSIGGSIFYIVLLLLGMLAVFDTQMLSIFRRKKEMGTLMALGMTRFKIIQLFTLEGAMHALLAAVFAAVYGIPILLYTASRGYGLPESTDSYGLAMGDRIFPIFSISLVVSTVLLVFTVTTIVSYLPARRIAKLKPTEALR